MTSDLWSLISAFQVSAFQCLICDLRPLVCFQCFRFQNFSFLERQPVSIIRANSRNSRRKFQYVSVSVFQPFSICLLSFSFLFSQFPLSAFPYEPHPHG